MLNSPALNQYNHAEDAEGKAHFAKRMAKYIAAAPANGFSVDDVTQEQVYPAAEVNQYINHPGSDSETDISEGEALKQVAEAVDVPDDVVRIGEGSGIVYYGYGCAPDRLMVGMTEKGDAKQRIVLQINTSTPDRPVL